MDESTFFKLYLPAVEEAINNDDKNSGFHVVLPVDYVTEEHFKEVDLFIDKNYNSYKIFFDMIATYFDAKSHYFNEIDGENINTYRSRLIERVQKLKNRI